MGGFLASLLVMQTMGLVIGAAGGYSFESFRLAWTVQYAIWTLADDRHPDHPQEDAPADCRKNETCWRASALTPGEAGAAR